MYRVAVAAERLAQRVYPVPGSFGITAADKAVATLWLPYGANWYGYAQGNPLLFCDPSGLQEPCEQKPGAPRLPEWLREILFPPGSLEERERQMRLLGFYVPPELPQLAGEPVDLPQGEGFDSELVVYPDPIYEEQGWEMFEHWMETFIGTETGEYWVGMDPSAEPRQWEPYFGVRYKGEEDGEGKPVIGWGPGVGVTW